MKKRFSNLNQLLLDYFKKCNDDHINAFGAMAAFFIIMSVFPIMIFLLMMTRYLPITKENIITAITDAMGGQTNYLVNGVINEIYRKTGSTLPMMALVAGIWSSSSGMYALILGLDSVYDIDETRNYFVLRLVSIIYTGVFLLVFLGMMLVWVFGNSLFKLVESHLPAFYDLAEDFLETRTIVTFPILTFVFMLMYQFVPSRKSKFIRQLPGAVIATIGWLMTSSFCSYYVDNFPNFNYIYGSMTGIMIIFLWLYLCMCFVFYGAEVNYFFENKKNYHKLIRVLRPNWNRQRRAREEEIRGGDAHSPGTVPPQSVRRRRKNKQKNSPEFEELVKHRVEERKKAE